MTSSCHQDAGPPDPALWPFLSSPCSFFCPANTSSVAGNECPAGHYCPASTTFASQFPCPRGTYKPQRGGVHRSDCSPCEPGKGQRLERSLSALLTTLSHALPYPVCLCLRSGSNEAQECLRKLALKGNTQTLQLHLRPILLFSLGSYCLLPGLVTPSGLCSAGFYCNRGASVPNPTDGITGDLCPAGHFCPQGSPHPVPCAPGRSPMCEVCSRPLRQEELGPRLGGLLGKDTEDTREESGCRLHRTSVEYVVCKDASCDPKHGPASG